MQATSAAANDGKMRIIALLPELEYTFPIRRPRLQVTLNIIFQNYLWFNFYSDKFLDPSL